MTQRIGNPFPFFADKSGLPLDGGAIYIGAQGADPELTPLAVYLDPEFVVEAPQPLQVIGGFACHDGNPVSFYVNADNYSMRVRNADGAETFYIATAIVAAVYQPLDSDLTAIAALGTTAFGRGLLATASAAGLRAYAGVPDCLPLAGGTVTGGIVHSGAGAVPYMADVAYTDPKIFYTAHGAADPTTADGQLWLEAAT